MSKQVSFSGWIAIIPDSMIKSWIKKKYIPNDNILNFGEFGDDRDSYPTELLETEVYDAMRNEVHEWYDKVFDYVVTWLKDNDFLKIKKGDIRTELCVQRAYKVPGL